jgi:hypothetical protein
MKKVSIIQPNYIPWIGYFDIISKVDEFVFLDDVQFTKRDWRNRNYINSDTGKKLISIPVNSKGKFTQKIYETNCIDDKWKDNHLRQIKDSYRLYPNFKMIYNFLTECFYKSDSLNLLENLYNINLALIDFLKIKTKIHYSKNFSIKTNKQDKIIKICKQIGASIYLTGPLALNYLETKLFEKENISVEFINYKKYNYEIQNKKHKFIENLSIVDLLMNEGSNSYLKLKN